MVANVSATAVITQLSFNRPVLSFMSFTSLRPVSQPSLATFSPKLAIPPIRTGNRGCETRR